MQIILNQNETTQAVVEFVRDQLSLPEEATVVVEVNDDGTASVLVNEESDQPSQSGGNTNGKSTKRSRRTKAQIEADNQAEEDRRLAAQAANAQQEEAAVTAEVAGNVAATQTDSVETAQVSEDVSNSDAGSDPEPETPVDPQPDEPAVAVKEETTKPSIAEQARQAAADDVPPVRTQSLFANLKKPNNQQ